MTVNVLTQGDRNRSMPLCHVLRHVPFTEPIRFDT